MREIHYLTTMCKFFCRMNWQCCESELQLLKWLWLQKKSTIWLLFKRRPMHLILLDLRPPCIPICCTIQMTFIVVGIILYFGPSKIAFSPGVGLSSMYILWEQYPAQLHINWASNPLQRAGYNNSVGKFECDFCLEVPFGIFPFAVDHIVCAGIMEQDAPFDIKLHFWHE